MKPDEIRKLDAYFKRLFRTEQIEVRARPRKDDSCELYFDGEFLGVIDKIEEEGETSFNLAMAILDIDLE